MRGAAAAALPLALAVVAALFDLATTAAVARSFVAAPAPSSPPAQLRILVATNAGPPPSASYAAAVHALCSSAGVTCTTSASPPGAVEFGAVADGLYDGVLAEVKERESGA